MCVCIGSFSFIWFSFGVEVCIIILASLTVVTKWAGELSSGSLLTWQSKIVQPFYRKQQPHGSQTTHNKWSVFQLTCPYCHFISWYLRSYIHKEKKNNQAAFQHRNQKFEIKIKVTTHGRKTAFQLELSLPYKDKNPLITNNDFLQDRSSFQFLLCRNFHRHFVKLNINRAWTHMSSVV